MWRTEKERGLRLMWRAGCGKATRKCLINMGEVCLWIQVHLGGGYCLLPGTGQDTFIKGKCVLFYSCCSWFPLAQNNPFVKVACGGPLEQIT